MATAFVDAERCSTALSAARERQCLIWLATRTPRVITSDHLTALALVGSVMTGVSFWVGGTHPAGLIWVVFWLGVNWLGDSLDGTLARVRNRQRPRYGFYIDHVLDTLGILFIVGGLALSGFMSASMAGILLIAYYLLSIELYLATYCVGTFQMSFWRFGPTELRILLAIGSVALLVRPWVTIADTRYLLFDVGGAVAAAALLLAALLSAIRHTRQLYRAETPPGPARVR
jgi:archaetidylinositol phosphate synthase